MSDPWLIERPMLLSVSGGRSSMYMLWRYLDRHNGQLPEHAVAVFCNTGREHPKTLDFVQRCSAEWACPIIWLEYQDAEVPGNRWRVVNHNSASRNGEPFDAVIKRKGFLPNPNTMQGGRFCTTELKIHCSHRWARAMWQHGAGRYIKAIGFRADEGHRVAKAMIRCGARKDAWDLCWPLSKSGIVKSDIVIATDDGEAIGGWWAEQPFDLGLPERLGNCDMCFLKHKDKLGKNIEENPSIADWWINHERVTGKRFLGGYKSYVDIKRWALSNELKPWNQGSLFDGVDLLDIECVCTD